jgi:hypothetical protein
MRGPEQSSGRGIHSKLQGSSTRPDFYGAGFGRAAGWLAGDTKRMFYLNCQLSVREQFAKALVNRVNHLSNAQDAAQDLEGSGKLVDEWRDLFEAESCEVSVENRLVADAMLSE